MRSEKAAKTRSEVRAAKTAAPGRWTVRIVFAMVVLNALTQFSIQAWMSYRFAKDVWTIPQELCVAVIAALDLFAVSFMIFTYLLRAASLPTRAYVWLIFAAGVGAQLFAAELYGAHESWKTPVRIFAALPALFLAASLHGLIIVTRRGALSAAVANTVEAEAVAGVPVETQYAYGQPGVYRAMGADPGPPLYIGSTTNLAQRLVSHKSASKWFPQVARWTFEAYPTIDEARTVERALIAAEQPIYNEHFRTAPVKLPSNRTFPKGSVVEAVPPTVNPSTVPPRPTAQVGRGRRSSVSEGQRDEFAKRVVENGERPADLAVEVGKSKRAVEIWVQDYRRRHAPVPQVNGHEFHPDGRPEVAVN